MKLGDLRKFFGDFGGLNSAQAHTEAERRLREAGLDPGAFYQELEMTSPLVDTHRDVSWSNTRLQLHSHSFYELLWCVSGKNVEYLVGPERYRLQQGDLVFVPPGVSHRPLLPEHMEEPYCRYVLWLSPEFMERFSRLYPYPLSDKQAQPSLLRTQGTRWSSLEKLFLAGVRESEQQQDGWQASVVGNTLMLLAQVKRATDDRSAQAPEAEKPELLDRIMAYVESHYPDSITIEALAREFYVSESTVSHLFKEKMGSSFYRYVTQRRLIGAKRLIAEGYPLEEVARKVGFLDYSGFYRAFRKEYGISPRQYRSLQTAQKTGTF